MIGTGHGKNKRTGALLLLLLFILGLTCLALPQAAESGVATAWVRRYNSGSLYYRGYLSSGVSSMAVDSLGNVYLAGSSVGSSSYFDYTTIKYGPDGRQLWVRRFDADIHDRANAIALDGQGNVNVTGTVGSQWSIWRSSDYATLKYDTDGNRLWARRYDGPGHPYYSTDWDEATAIAVDGQGNVYITGTSWGNASTSDILTIKYSPEGRRLWVRRFHKWYGAGASAMALDNQGNVYVAGTFGDGPTWDDYGVVKYSPEGRLLWASTYNGPASGHDYASAITVDPQGNVYVTGSSKGAGGEWDYDCTTIKLDTNGNLLWASRYEQGGGSALAVDGQGNVYVTGGNYNTIKYGPDGEELWVRRYQGPGNGQHWATALALDPQGNVYITGESDGGITGIDFATIKYGPDGQELWVMRYNGPGDRFDSAAALALDSQGNVYVTGTSTNLYGEDCEYVTIKYLQSPRVGR